MPKVPGRSTDDPSIESLLWRNANASLDSKVDLDHAVQDATEDLYADLRLKGVRVSERISSAASTIVDEWDAAIAEFGRGLMEDWGTTLAHLHAVASLAFAAADRFDARRQTQSPLHDAILGLTARAIRTTRETHHLLRAGYVAGALARGRTCHELAVTSAVLDKYGSDPDHEELAEKYLSHRVVKSWREASRHRGMMTEHALRTISEEQFRELEQRAHELLDRWGPSYTRTYGWASGVVGNPDPPRTRHTQ